MRPIVHVNGSWFFIECLCSTLLKEVFDLEVLRVVIGLPRHVHSKAALVRVGLVSLDVALELITTWASIMVAVSPKVLVRDAGLCFHQSPSLVIGLNMTLCSDGITFGEQSILMIAVDMGFLELLNVRVDVFISQRSER